MRVVRFDRNATYGLLPSIRERFCDALSGIDLNPNPVHSGGQRARATIENCRRCLSEVLFTGPATQIIFTSGATEANNLAIFGATAGNSNGEERSIQNQENILTAATEHPSILEPYRALESRGFTANYYVRQRSSAFCVNDFCAQISRNTRLVSLMLANNETGEIFPVAEVAAEIRRRNSSVHIHCDAVQAFGKVHLNFSSLGVDSMSISGHKIGALSGIGALIVKHNCLHSGHIIGGPQESHLRAGTQNVAGILSFELAVREIYRDLNSHIFKMKTAKALFMKELAESSIDVCPLKIQGEQLPNTLNLHIPGVQADDLVVAMDQVNVQISSGAACASGKPDPSHVLLAMGYDETYARQSVRLSFGSDHSQDDIKYAADEFAKAINNLRRNSVCEVYASIN